MLAPESGGAADGPVLSMPGGNPRALWALAADLDRHGTDLADLAHDLGSHTAAIPGYANWRGVAADGFATLAAGTAATAARLPALLASAAAEVRAYADALHAAQQEVAYAADRLADIGGAGAALAEVEAMAVVDRATASAAQAAATAASVLGTLADGIDGLWHDAPGEVRQVMERIDAFSDERWVRTTYDAGRHVAKVPAILTSLQVAGREFDRFQALRAIKRVAGRDDNVAGLVRMASKSTLFAVEESYRQPWKLNQLGASALRQSGLESLATKLEAVPGEGVFTRRVLLPMSVVDGVHSAVDPAHSGVHGRLDQVAGAGQAVGAVMVLAGVATPAGWIALGGAGAYYAGSYLWDHREAIVGGLEDVGSGAYDLGESAVHGVGQFGSDTADGGRKLWHWAFG